MNLRSNDRIEFSGLDNSSASDDVFHGDLPDGCPPNDGICCGERTAIRLVKGPHVNEQDFLSQCEEGKRKPFSASECKFRAVSYFDDATRKQISKVAPLRGLPKLSGLRYAAYVQLKSGDGIMPSHEPGRNGHISLWRRKSFSPADSILKVVPLDV